jgi:hypothetical protein
VSGVRILRPVGAALMAVAVITAVPAHAKKGPPKGFRFVPEWGVYASPDDVFWHDGLQWRLQPGGWFRLDAGRWVVDPAPPPVLLGIPPAAAHCPPGLAKKGCVPPGQRKKYGPPGHGKHW